MAIPRETTRGARGRLHQWLKEQKEKQSQSRWLICNSQVEVTGEEVGHWVMLEHQVNIQKIYIWDPLRHKVKGIKEIEATCQMQGFGVEYRGLGKQTDGWSCGYHMLECG